MSLEDFYRRIDRVTGVSNVVPLHQRAPAPAAKPVSWIFVPIRDEDNLIISITATPIDTPIDIEEKV